MSTKIAVSVDGLSVSDVENVPYELTMDSDTNKRKREEQNSMSPSKNKKAYSENRVTLEQNALINSTALKSTSIKTEPKDNVLLSGEKDTLENLDKSGIVPMEFIHIKQETDQVFLKNINKNSVNQNVLKLEKPLKNGISPIQIMPKGKMIKILRVLPNTLKVLPKTSLIQAVNRSNVKLFPTVNSLQTKPIIINQNDNIKKEEPEYTSNDPPYNAKEDQAIYSFSNFLNRKYLQADCVDFFTVLKRTTLGDKNIAKIVSDHIVGRSEESVKERLVNVIYKDKFLYTKPTLLFEIILEYKNKNGFKSATKMIGIFSQNTMLVLKCKYPKGSSCSDHHPAASVKLQHDPNSDFGVDESLLHKFLQELAPRSLRLPKDVKDLKIMMKKSRVSFHAKSQCHILNSECATVEESQLYSLNETNITSEIGVVLTPDQVEHFKRIVNDVEAASKSGKDPCWKTIYELLCLSSSFPFDPSDVQMMEILKKYYITQLDSGMSTQTSLPELMASLPELMAPFSTEEDQQVWLLLNCLGSWNMVAKHLPGRTAQEVQIRTTTLALQGKNLKENILSFTLMVIPKNKPHLLSLNCLVVGTRSEMFLYLCEDAAQFCDHGNLSMKSFVFDPKESDEQFVNYLRLTYCNELVSKGLVDQSFSYTNLQYKGVGIHDFMKKHCFGVFKSYESAKQTMIRPSRSNLSSHLSTCSTCKIHFVHKHTPDRHLHSQHNLCSGYTCPVPVNPLSSRSSKTPYTKLDQLILDKEKSKEEEVIIKEEHEVISVKEEVEEEIDIKHEIVVKEEIFIQEGIDS